MKIPVAKKQELGTCAVLYNSKGEILLGKRKNAYKAGQYGLPGGRIEVNEPLHECAKREIREETSLDITDLHYAGVVRENQGEFDFVHFVFTADIGKAKPQLCEPEKCEGWEWLKKKDIEKNASKVLNGHLAAVDMVDKGIQLLDIVQ